MLFRKKFSKRDIKEFNKFRKFTHRMICSWTYGLYLRIFCGIEVEGRQNILKGKKFIAAGNHTSGKDPFVLSYALNLPIAFMAKQELFEKFFSRWLMDWCGAFSVNRQKLEVSTIKTALAIKNTDWILGLFPQGTRQKDGQITNVEKGFAVIAKTLKEDILPVAILPKGDSRKIIVRIGEIIPYSDDVDAVMKEWSMAIQKLLNPEVAAV